MKKILFILTILALLTLAGCGNKDMSGQAIGDLSDDAINKLCAETPAVCSCVQEHRNFDLCICLQQAAGDYLMQDNCWWDFTGSERPQ